jgi:hypothetical protein
VIIHLLRIQMELEISTTYILYMFIMTILSPTSSPAVDYSAWYKPVVHCVIGVDYAALRAMTHTERVYAHDSGPREG